MKISFEVDSERVHIRGFRTLVERVGEACQQHDAPFFVVGALARDLLLEHVHGITAPRATRDVDLALAVPTWEQYEALRRTLINEHQFAPHDQPHRLRSPEGVLTDLIPFGDLEEPPGKIGWPPDQEFVMTTTGFRAAYEGAVTVVLDGDLPVEVASLAGLGALKLLAWSDRRHRRGHDAGDFCFILRNYYDAVGDALYTAHIDLFEVEPFDRDLTSARIYGRDVGDLLQLSQPLKEAVLAILDEQTQDVYDSPLAGDMGNDCMLDIERRFDALKAFRWGLSDRTAR